MHSFQHQWFWLNGVLLIYSPGCCFLPLPGHKYGLVAFLCILILFSIQFPTSTIPGRECIHYTYIFMIHLCKLVSWTLETFSILIFGWEISNYNWYICSDFHYFFISCTGGKEETEKCTSGLAFEDILFSFFLC